MDARRVFCSFVLLHMWDYAHCLVLFFSDLCGLYKAIQSYSKKYVIYKH